MRRDDLYPKQASRTHHASSPLSLPSEEFLDEHLRPVKYAVDQNLPDDQSLLYKPADPRRSLLAAVPSHVGPGQRPSPDSSSTSRPWNPPARRRHLFDAPAASEPSAMSRSHGKAGPGSTLLLAMVMSDLRSRIPRRTALAGHQKPGGIAIVAAELRKIAEVVTARLILAVGEVAESLPRTIPDHGVYHRERGGASPTDRGSRCGRRIGDDDPTSKAVFILRTARSSGPAWLGSIRPDVGDLG